jgi:hypothetical protein
MKSAATINDFNEGKYFYVFLFFFLNYVALSSKSTLECLMISMVSMMDSRKLLTMGSQTCRKITISLLENRIEFYRPFALVIKIRGSLS